jgi:hypothetical protein
MKRNLATIHSVDTPLFDQSFDDFDDILNLQSSDPMRTIGMRMMFILVTVCLVAIALAFLAMPVTSQAKSFEQNVVSVSSENEVTNTNEDEIQNVSTNLISNDGRVAGFFTPEVLYWEPKIIGWANLHGVDPNAIATIMQIESCGDPQAVSVAGARGLFQVMPFHFSDGEDMLDPDTNATRGMNFFNEQLRYTGGDVFLSFAGYNGGYAASGGAYANWANETQRYYEWARGIYQDANDGLESSETLDKWLAAGGAAGCQRAADRLGLN